MIVSFMIKLFTGGRRSFYWGAAGISLAAAMAIVSGCTTPRAHHPVGVTEPFWPHIFVSGDFNNPGYCPWTNGLTLPDAIDLAGGFFPGAARSLYVRHPDGTTQKYKLTIEYRCTNNVVLQRNDEVINLDEGGS
jgi:hypothetical protein